MSQAPTAPAATFVIFGAMGDLTKRLLMPALVNLTRSHLLAEDTGIVGVSYHDEDDGALRDAVSEFVDKDGAWDQLSGRIRYFKGDFTEDQTYSDLAGQLKGNIVFYLATSPGFFGPVVEKLGAAGLLKQEDGFRRIVIEKPFGTDLESAHALNEQILKQANEDQVYRIDHFLGKETVQNLMVFRFANPMIEAVWNGRFIDHVEITAAEAVTVGTRGKFYEATGALRDMVPNHLFQLLALVGMEPPNSFDAEAVRTEKSKVIAAVLPASPDDAVRGQYGAGVVGGKPIAAYREEADVAADSRMETYAAMKLAVRTWRWSGVPFYLRTGKALTARDTEIVIHFKDVPLKLFRDGEAGSLPPNRMLLQIQPDEGITMEVGAKTPGPLVEVAPVKMTFAYTDHFALGHTTGYETLLYDVLMGDQTLFQRADQIEGGWRAVQPLLDAWTDGEPEPYAAGAEGPAGAGRLMERDGRSWHGIA